LVFLFSKCDSSRKVFCLVCWRSPKHVWSWRPVGQRAVSSPAGLWAMASQGHGSMGVVAHLFFQCMVVWWRLPWLGVKGAEVSALPGAPSVKCVSSISARSLIHRIYAVCICVPVTILDLLHFLNSSIWHKLD
jgi:hypothetical protein